MGGGEGQYVEDDSECVVDTRQGVQRYRYGTVLYSTQNLAGH